MTIETRAVTINRMFTGRRTAKNTLTMILNALHTMDDYDGETTIAVYVRRAGSYHDRGSEIILSVKTNHADAILPLMIMGSEFDDYLDANECEEFYSGVAISRFRGV